MGESHSLVRDPVPGACHTAAVRPGAGRACQDSDSLFPYELPCHVQGWDTGPKVGRGGEVLLNCYLVTHCPVHHPCMRKEERQEQARAE